MNAMPSKPLASAARARSTMSGMSMRTWGRKRNHSVIGANLSRNHTIRSTKAVTSFSWGSRADERSQARPRRAPSRRSPASSRFMRSALAILGETGRTDFTVLEVVERSKTSLRSFYQHFSTKDELLLALIDRIMVESTARWREDTDDLDAVTALHRLIERISAPAASTTQDSINRGLTYYNDHLAESLPRRVRQSSLPAARSHRRHPRGGESPRTSSTTN